MHIITIAFCALIVFAGVSANKDAEPQENGHEETGIPANPNFLIDATYVTRVDHFRPQDSRKLTFPYKINELFYRDGGPIFVYINDAGQYITRWIEEGLMFDLALEMGGAMITSDHRYFRQSLPTETASFEDLQYLSVEQGLADIATLIRSAKLELNSTANVILFGVGLGAKLAVWARQAYPHIIDGVWSSSGVFQPDPISFNFYGNLDWNIYYRGGETCAYRIATAFSVMEYLIENDDSLYLQYSLHLCDPVDADSDNDIAMFFETQIAFISNYIEEYHIHGIHEICRAMGAVENDPFNSYARWLNFTYGANSECFDMNYERRMEMLTNTNWFQPGTDSGLRQAFYSQCTQLGYMKATSEFSMMFPNRISANYQFETCERILGENYQLYKLNEATRALNIHYAGRNQQATRVIYTNGLLNPWVYDGITQSLAPDTYVYNMEFSARGSDLDSIVGWESAEITNTKYRIIELVRQWASE